MSDKKAWYTYISGVKKIVNHLSRQSCDISYKNVYVSNAWKWETGYRHCNTAYNHGLKVTSSTKQQRYVDANSIPDVLYDDVYYRDVKVCINQEKYEIDFVLDLHMHSIEQAYSTLESSIWYVTKHNGRLLLVITGRGSEERPSVLRELVPAWVQYSKISPYVLYCTVAHKKHGGNGAFYIVLKKNKKCNSETLLRFP